MTDRDTKRIVIADAGPLIALARIEALYLLRDLFGRICITTTVRNELLPAETTFADSDLLAHALNKDLIDVVTVPPSNDKPLNPVSMQEKPAPFKWPSNGKTRDTLY